MATPVTERIHVNPRQKVLFVDDDQDTLQLLQVFLNDFPEVEPEFYQDSVKALEVLTKDPVSYAAVVLDWNMPGYTGFEILTILRKMPECRYLPILMMTARTSDQDIQRGMKAGAFYYMIKPLNRGFFLTILKSALQAQFHLTELKKEATDYSNASTMLSHGSFELRTPEESEQIAAWLSRGCPNPAAANLGLNELIINAIEHGNLEITYDEKTQLMKSDNLRNEISKRLAQEEYAGRVVKIEFERTSEKILFTITDDGKGFDYNYYLDFSLERAYDNHGRGIIMARNLYFDEMEYIPPGNKVIASIHLNKN